VLFVITHQHPIASCMADDPGPLQTMLSAEHVQATGVRVLGDYIAPPEHRLFLVVEADEYAQVVRFLPRSSRSASTTSCRCSR
jgi:hypothetical protein